MKKIILTVCTLAVLVSGCKKELVQFPYNQVETTQAFNTETDVALAVSGMYAGFRTSASYFAGTWNIMGDVMADNLVFNVAGRGSLKSFYEWRYTGESTYNLFSGGYTIIRRANAIIENIDKLPETAFTRDAKGQAYAVRAITYFDMTRVYSKTYQNATDADLTVPYVITTDPTIKPAKESLRGVYEKIIADFVQSEALINSATTVASGKLNKAAIAGYLSRVYFYKGDYPNTIAAAGRALGATPNLPNMTDFSKIWTDAADAGVLFKVRNTAIDNVNSQGVNYFQTVAQGIKSEYTIDYTFFQMFAANDIRKAAYTQTSAFNGTLQNHVIKFRGRAGQAAGVVDAKVLRTAEVLLNRMEAEYFTDPAAALTDLNLLKSNRYTAHVPVVLTGAALLAEIQKERRLELAFEADRFFDLKRRNASVNRDAVHGENADGTGTPPVFPTLLAGDKRFLLPFPQSEINFNTNLIQNPGY